MSFTSSSSDEYVLDESVLAFLAKCEMANEILDLPVVADDTTLQLKQTDVSMTPSTRINTSIPLQKPSTKKKESWRAKRRVETENLKVEVKLLLTELERLKIRAGVHSSLQGSGSDVVPETNLAVTTREMKHLWEIISRQQFILRHQSEEARDKLRDTLRLQLQEAKSLQRAVRRKLQKYQAASVTRLPPRFQCVDEPSNNRAVFDILLEGIDDLYTNLDSVFQHIGMDKLSCPGQEGGAIDSGAQGVFVEFLDSYAVPFDIQQTVKVVWTGSSQNPNFFYLQTFSQDSNTRMVSLCFPLSLEGIDLRMVLRSVTRKYVKENQAAFITRSLIESAIGTASFAFVEVNRMVLKQGKLSAFGSTTVMHTYREATLPRNTVSHDTTKYPSMEGGLKIWQEAVRDFNHSVEDQLLRAAPKTSN